ncbi:MAG: ribbon-helix-helix domain-containing protein [Actinomycetota bacterium]|nr:ribbon-helix-helix domain-containing protein [Actinomycetota bacterium]
MKKTTVYLDTEMLATVKLVAKLRGTSEAEVIREAIRAGVVSPARAPRGGLFSVDPMAHRVDELLAGFGTR